MPDSDSSKIISQLKSGQLLTVSKSRRNGLIVYKPHYAEFAGPGAAVGGSCDLDCYGVYPVGNLDLVSPDTLEDRQRAFATRLQWVKFTNKFTNHSNPLDRAQGILQHFEAFFGAKTVATIPDIAFALMVGVFPQTIEKARSLTK
ncbi:hypothetical protein [Roseofilum casamattae]|uniref:Uncharacterized protein n=1 Tax=Roseofilum casamattae BLCC-M143 TaxID=3022442 RepID=A0ABT7BZP1_9CYAN|nr:hypothetical protein [Roseofilum casamattae]MDJ1183934.1 hypothetical protein [Roseofilum casamattae BLCC-M143]